MNKAELLAYIATLVAQLTELNIEFTPAETKGTNAELEQEIERLESLLPDETEGETEDKPAATETQNEAAQATEQALENSKSEDKALKEDAAKVEQTTRRVFIFRGVNIETIKDGSKVVLQGDNSHTVNADLARSIVAENHGRYEAAEADEF